MHKKYIWIQIVHHLPFKAYFWVLYAYNIRVIVIIIICASQKLFTLKQRPLPLAH